MVWSDSQRSDSAGGGGAPRDDAGRGAAPRDETVGGEDTVGGTGSSGGAERDAAVGWHEGFLVAERFRIVRHVAAGGMGSVYMAQDEILGRPIALKRIPQEILFDGDARDDLRDEANRLLDLAHENIVRVHTYYDGPTWPFFAMELLQGPTLKRLLAQRTELGAGFSPREVLAVARQVARGLAHAHSKDVIHRDLKPSNLMLADAPGKEIRDTDVVKITDFGISRVVADGSLRQKGKLSGTVPYMSPEQFRGEASTVQSDIYSFACTLYELASGRPPFHSGDIGYQILHVSPRSIPDLPRGMNAAILKGLSKEPQRRFSSAEELLEALEGRAASRGLPFGGAGARKPVSSGWAGVAVASALVICAALLFVLTGGLRGARDDASGSDGSIGRARLAPDPAPGDSTEREFRKRLSDEIARKIPPTVGQPHASGRLPLHDAIALSFIYPRPESSAERGLLEGLLLEVYAKGAKGKVVQKKGEYLPDGRMSFELSPLQQGEHTLNAYIVGRSGEPRPILDNIRFTVDLIAPTLDIEVINPRAFLEPFPPHRTTFDDVIHLRIVSTDIAEAYYQVVGDGPPVSQRIEDPSLWKIRLPVGMTSYRVFAEDAAGNRSHATEIGFRRLRLSIESLELAYPVWGNLAHVKGILTVDGEESPDLKYFINDQLVQREPMGTSAPPDESWKPMPERGGVPFSELLRLPDITNLIEVQYSWKGNPPRPFALPARIKDVRVKAPQVTILSEPPERTNSARIFLEGRVEPFFEGLDVQLENVGAGSVWLPLIRSSGGDYATFERDVQLIPGQENTIRIECYYRDRQLAAEAGLRTVICDRKPPTLQRPVTCHLFGERLQVTIHPSEQLRLLRIKELVGMESPGEWRVVEPVDFSLSYQYATAAPRGPLTFQLEMTDLAGNVAVMDAPPVMEILPPPPEVASGRPEKSSGKATDPRGKETPVPVEREPVAPGAPGFTMIQSDFVKLMGMEFRPFGHERLEMSLTEVPERPWLLFLGERRGPGQGLDALGFEGRLDHPMILEDETPELLRQFVKWFETRSRDGYTYFIPTRAQWMGAFSGSSEPDQAESRIVEWFEKTFEPSPAVRYGVNQVQAMKSRRENLTPTNLYDMESNLQEVVLEGETLKVIGGMSRDGDAHIMRQHCLKTRPYSADQRRMTGFRICRKPAR